MTPIVETFSLDINAKLDMYAVFLSKLLGLASALQPHQGGMMQAQNGLDLARSDSFIKAISEIGALHIHRLDFSDHHSVQSDDIKLIKDNIRKLTPVYNNQAAILVIETVSDFG